MTPRKPTKPKTPAPAEQSTAELCAYCTHPHYIVTNENAEPRGHYAPCACGCEQRTHRAA